MPKGSDRVEPLERRILPVAARFAIVGGNRSVLHAAKWLSTAGAALVGEKSIERACALDPAPLAILISGDTAADEPVTRQEVPLIFLWDFEVGQPGIGAFASAVSGVSSVIGKETGAPGVLPVHVPEQWAGIFGANLALSQMFHRADDGCEKPFRMDVSAADILRSFAEQNSGNHAGVPYGWRRNGLTAVEHGGVFPQGFFACKDGHVAVQARSRQDWTAILAALGNPGWSTDPAMQNPFTLSEDDSLVMPLFQTELAARGMRELLDAAIETGAPMAPVLTPEQAASWDVFRPGFLDEDNAFTLPFAVRRHPSGADT